MLTLCLAAFCQLVLAAEDVHGQKVGYVYQYDNSDTTKFDVDIPERPHECGSTLYRSSSTSDAIANRKFTLILTAFVSDKKISFKDINFCCCRTFFVG